MRTMSLRSYAVPAFSATAPFTTSDWTCDSSTVIWARAPSLPSSRTMTVEELGRGLRGVSREPSDNNPEHSQIEGVWKRDTALCKAALDVASSYMYRMDRHCYSARAHECRELNAGITNSLSQTGAGSEGFHARSP